MSGIGSNVLLANMNSIVGSYETFVLRTKFPSALCIDLSDVDAANAFYTKLKSVKTGADLPQLMGALDNVTTAYGSKVSNNMNISSFSNASIFPYVFTNPPNAAQVAFIPSFINNFIANPLPPASSYSGIEASQLEFKAAFTNVFKQSYLLMSSYLQSQSSSTLGQDFNKTISDSLQAVNVSNILHYIEANVYSFMNSPLTTSQSIDTYISNLYDGLQNYVEMFGSNTQMSQSHYNLFFVCFLPYFYFLYIYNVLPSTVLTGSNKGSRDGVVRRYAILALYKTFMYTIYGTYKVSVLFDPSSQETMQLRLILDTNISALFDQETNQILAQSVLDKLNENTKTNLAKMSSLQQQNQKVVANRSNVQNISTYQVQANQDLSKAKIEKMVWFVFLIIYIATIPVVYFLLQKKPAFVEMYFMFSFVIVLILFIFGMVAMARNFS